jgi:uncharacterized protein YdeI (YjbR/CyaY-like superfamily)
MNAMNPKADFYFEAENNWQDALKRLRKIVLSCGLTEEVKWGTPCYTYGKSNIVLLHVFKEYCAMLFFKGALLNDTHGILVQQTANVQAARQARFTDARQVTRLASVLKAYIYEAIEAEKAGLKVTFKKTAAYSVPEEFQEKLDKRPALKKAFEALTPGRQRAYLLFFSSAKQPATRTARVEKYIQHILKGKGLNDE